MDDDGRSGRWMAGGNMGKLTPLEAFMSDDGKRGRVWRGEWMDGNAYFKRIDDITACDYELQEGVEE